MSSRSTADGRDAREQQSASETHTGHVACAIWIERINRWGLILRRCTRAKSLIAGRLELRDRFVEARLHNDGGPKKDENRKLQNEKAGSYAAPNYLIIDPKSGATLRSRAASYFHKEAANDLRMDVIPTKITPEIVHQAAADWENRPTGRLWTMLIGGRSRSHDFQNADWEKLAEGMTALAETEGIRWLVTTSRRTGIRCRCRSARPPSSAATASTSSPARG